MDDIRIEKQLPLTVVDARERLRRVVEHSQDFATDIRILKEAGILQKASPELARTWGKRGEQDANWHPEGNTWVHTCMVLDNLPSDASPRLRWAALFHDVGKPITFRRYPSTKGISNHGHAEAGADLFRTKLGKQLGIAREEIKEIATIIENHMLMHAAHDPERISPRMLRELLKLSVIEDLIVLQHADALGTGQPEAHRLRRSNRDFLTGKLAEVRLSDPSQREISLPSKARVLCANHAFTVLISGMSQTGPLVGSVSVQKQTGAVFDQEELERLLNLTQREGDLLGKKVSVIKEFCGDALTASQKQIKDGVRIALILHTGWPSVRHEQEAILDGLLKELAYADLDVKLTSEPLRRLALSGEPEHTALSYLASKSSRFIDVSTTEYEGDIIAQIAIDSLRMHKPELFEEGRKLDVAVSGFGEMGRSLLAKVTDQLEPNSVTVFEREPERYGHYLSQYAHAYSEILPTNAPLNTDRKVDLVLLASSEDSLTGELLAYLMNRTTVECPIVVVGSENAIRDTLVVQQLREKNVFVIAPEYSAIGGVLIAMKGGDTSSDKRVTVPLF